MSASSGADIFYKVMKFKGLLFCTDIDGTAYNDARTLSYENRQAIEYFKAHGGIFTFITGRVPLTAGSVYRDIKPNAPFGCVNGGGIYDGEKGKLVKYHQLPPLAKIITEDAIRAVSGIGAHLNTPENIYFISPDDEAEKLFCAFKTRRAEYKDVSEPVLKIVFTTSDMDKMDALINYLHSHPLANNFDFIRSEYTFYELLPKGISKATALYDLATLLRVDMKNTIAVGDYNNDIAMVKAAGTGYAVANAVDELKMVADKITVSNNEHAIARIIEEIS